ncbi:MAG: S1/P1 nuclease [Flavobacteriaceae bacterium]
MKSFIAACVFIVSSYALFTWGQNGHRIVAQICYNNLDNNAKEKVNEILGNEHLAQIATWPDFIRSEKNWDFTKPWHFITIDPDKNVQQVIDEAAKDPGVNNVYEAIELMTSILKDDQDAIKLLQDSVNVHKAKLLNNSIKATALAFLVHFIGDVHQPMHVGKNNDFGGNKISVLFFSEKTNLHTVWDTGIIEKEGLSFTDFSGFIEMHTAPNKKKWEKAKMIDWVKESVEYREKIYNTLYDNTDRSTGLPDMSYNYQHDFLEVVENRLGAAGYRAAKILNTLF